MFKDYYSILRLSYPASDEDIKNYLADLERKLKGELEDNTIINVEF